MINRTILQGRLTDTPELRKTPSEISVCNFTVAWSEKRNNAEDSKLFLNCTAWRKTAELIGAHFSKGQEIIVEGKLVQRKYTAKDGTERTIIEMPSVDSVHFCGKKSDGQTAPSLPVEATTVTDDFEEVGTDDDLPF